MSILNNGPVIHPPWLYNDHIISSNTYYNIYVVEGGGGLAYYYGDILNFKGSGMSLIDKVLAVISKEQSSFEQEEMTIEQIAFSCRDHAEPDNRPGEKDLTEGQRLLALVHQEVPGVTGTLDTFDEWVFITFIVDKQ
tara:strand:+ start:150381 stop:150791 length:411 start_codon:yes stop_codon:yes gene_type:complete